MDEQFELFWQIYLGNEGTQYVNDPNDAGGETKYGISKRSYPNEDIKNLTEERAKEIIRHDWWDRYGFGRLTSPMGAKICDLAVNMGTRPEIRLLQEAVNSLGGSLTVDGLIGPKTIAEANACSQRALFLAVCDQAAKHYHEIVDKHPEDAKFLKGWLNRAAQGIGMYATSVPVEATPPAPAKKAVTSHSLIGLLGLLLGVMAGGHMDPVQLMHVLVPDQYLPVIENAAQGIGALILVAVFLVSRTNTPDPSTRLGKIYRAVEWVAMVTEKTKQKGAK